jgi:hypothetical protein
LRLHSGRRKGILPEAVDPGGKCLYKHVMARPHTCFIQAQMIPWSPGLYGGARNDVTHKVLSIDDSDGSSSCIVRYPAAWQRSTAEVLDAHEEFLVLDGSLEINGRLYERHSYGFLPAGYPRRSARSTRGAILLNLFYGEPMASIPGCSLNTSTRSRWSGTRAWWIRSSPGASPSSRCARTRTPAK